jgi:hypothetical protein
MAVFPAELGGGGVSMVGQRRVLKRGPTIEGEHELSKCAVMPSKMM